MRAPCDCIGGVPRAARAACQRTFNIPLVGGRIKKKKGDYIVTEKENKILSKILKELGRIKNELKKSNVLRIKDIKK